MAERRTHHGNLASVKLDSSCLANKAVDAITTNHPRIDTLLDCAVREPDGGRDALVVLLQRLQLRPILGAGRVLGEDELTQGLLEIVLADLVGRTLGSISRRTRIQFLGHHTSNPSADIAPPADAESNRYCQDTRDKSPRAGWPAPCGRTSPSNGHESSSRGWRFSITRTGTRRRRSSWANSKPDGPPPMIKISSLRCAGDAIVVRYK